MRRIAKQLFCFGFESSIDKGLHELLLKVFDVIEAVRATSHLLDQFFTAGFLQSVCLVVAYSPVGG